MSYDEGFPGDRPTTGDTAWRGPEVYDAAGIGSAVDVVAAGVAALARRRPHGAS